MLVINWFILYETSVTEYKRKGKERGEKREGRVGGGTEAVKGMGGEVREVHGRGSEG